MFRVALLCLAGCSSIPSYDARTGACKEYDSSSDMATSARCTDGLTDTACHEKTEYVLSGQVRVSFFVDESCASIGCYSDGYCPN